VETNDDTITQEDAACGYKGLMVTECCFRTLKKTDIKMSPLCYWGPHRIEAHVKICASGLLIEQVAEFHCEPPRSRILHSLQELQISYFSTRRHRFFRRNQLTHLVRRILKSLQINRPRLIQDPEERPQDL
jgi:transposase